MLGVNEILAHRRSFKHDGGTQKKVQCLFFSYGTLETITYVVQQHRMVILNNFKDVITNR